MKREYDVMKIIQPSNLELQVLAVLWEQGPATARQVLEALPDKKERAYTTVLSVMQVMEKKGLLKHKADGNRHVYSPTVRKGEILGPFLRSLVANLFSGSATHALQHLLANAKVSTAELTEMRALLDEAARKQTQSLKEEDNL